LRIAREAFPFATGLLLLAGAVALWSPWASVAPLCLLAFTLYFFRDPDRKTPARPGVIVSPADGRIIRAAGGHVSVFLNLLDVHVCRAPTGGRIQSVAHVPGRFLAAFKDAASEQNERTSIVLEGEHASLSFTLVAGVLARRIVCKVAPGQCVRAGERIGLIRFGSRVDMELPPSACLEVRLGDRVIAGETVIGTFGKKGEKRGQVTK